MFAEIRQRTTVPRRTDPGNLLNYRPHKHKLFGKQEGQCAGHRMMFPLRNFEVDHVIRAGRAGRITSGNQQLLCGACNRAKGTSTQAQPDRQAQGARPTGDVTEPKKVETEPTMDNSSGQGRLRSHRVIDQRIASTTLAGMSG